MLERFHNFNPGPAALPKSVLNEVAQAVYGTEGGTSILTVSHRSPEYEEIHFSAQRRILDLMELPCEEYDVLFLQGGASQQSAMLPMNFLRQGQAADYINTGYWSERAIDEAKLYGNVNVAASFENSGYPCIPEQFSFNPDARYVHLTTNNTIEGTQWNGIPDTKDVPLVVDASSDFLAIQRDFSRFALVYAGAQKNVGSAGVTIVVARKSFLETSVSEDVARIFFYKTHSENKSLYNTPAVFEIFVVSKMLEWIELQGGLLAIEDKNRHKAQIVYGVLDEFPAIYEPAVKEAKDRSVMNVTFRLRQGLEKDFLAGTEKRQMIGLAGHRSVGGIRASLYNGLPLESAQALAEYMQEFARLNS